MKEWYRDFIGVYENAFPLNLCDRLIDLASQHTLLPRHPREGSNLQKQDFGNHIHTFKEDLSDKVTYHLQLCVNQYINKYPIFAQHFPLIPTGYKYQKTYPSGGYHVWHSEAISFMHRNRVAVWTLYLNDIDDGGETEFLYQSLRISPKKGTICIFPSGYTHVHRGNPPLSETKHIVTGWMDYVEPQNLKTK